MRKNLLNIIALFTVSFFILSSCGSSSVPAVSSEPSQTLPAETPSEENVPVTQTETTTEETTEESTAPPVYELFRR